jgi:hypothetical protein
VSTDTAPVGAAGSQAQAPVGGATSRSPSRRVPWPLVIAVGIFLVAELLVRSFADSIPAPVIWSGPEMQIKYSQMQHLRHTGRTGGIVIVGSSVADVGFDPARMATDAATRIPIYNASLLGANVETVRWWTDHVVIPILHPREIVFGVSSREVNANDPEGAQLGAQFFAAPAVRHLSGTESFWERLERYGGDVSYLFRYRKTFRHPSQLVDQSTSMQFQEKQSTSLGFELFFTGGMYQRSAADNNFFQTTILRHFAVAPSKVGIIAGILDDVHRAGIRMLVVDVPVTQDYVALHPAGGYAAYRQALAGVVARAGDRLVLGPVWPNAFFSDPLHVNGAGAGRLTAMVAGIAVTPAGR